MREGSRLKKALGFLEGGPPAVSYRSCICSVLRTEQIPRGVPVPPANPPGEERSPGKGNPFPESPTRRRRRFPASKRHRRPGANPEPLLRERFGVSFRFTPRRGGIGTVYPISRYMPLKRIIIGGRSLRYLPAAAIRLFSFTHD